MTVADSKSRASSAAVNEEIWYGVNPKLQLFRASGFTKYTSFIDIDIGIKNTLKHYNKAAEAAIKTKSLCFIFLGHPVYTIVNCSLLVFGVVVIVKRHDGRLGLVDDRVLGGEVQNQQELIQNG